MSEYDNTNRGVLFKNDRKESDNHPDMTGSINVNGTEHYLSAWTKTSKNGKKFLSVSIGKAKVEAQKPKEEFFDDDLSGIPF